MKKAEKQKRDQQAKRQLKRLQKTHEQIPTLSGLNKLTIEQQREYPERIELQVEGRRYYFKQPASPITLNP